eukprot:m.62513 g.62513  ORF g.62513 m.62513 type:complete len:781 (-) comp11513_c0_seq2:231-2573(-)
MIAMQRSNSVVSLSGRPITGALRLTLSWQPSNEVRVVCHEGANLGTADSYIKLYLSNEGKDLKQTKQKTKSKKKSTSPVYDESFTFRAQLPEAHKYRLQVSVWDHSGLKAHCYGGFSVGISDIIKSRQLSSWFKLLNPAEGRALYELLDNTVSQPTAPATNQKPSTSNQANDANSSQISTTSVRKKTTQLEKVVARHNYKAEHEEELSFEVGDVILVSDKRETGWWAGHLNGKAGWFPADYVVAGNVVVVVKDDKKAASDNSAPTREESEPRASSTPTPNDDEPISPAIDNAVETSSTFSDGDVSIVSQSSSKAAKKGIESPALPRKLDGVEAPTVKDRSESISRLTPRSESSYKASPSEVANLQVKLDAAKARESRLESEKEALEASLRNLREQHVKAARDHQAALSDQVGRLSASSNSLEQRLATALETVTKEREERYKLEETVAELEEKLRDSEDSCSRAHKQIASLEETAAGASQEIENEFSKRQQATKEVQTLKEALELKQQEIDDKNAELDSVKSMADEFKSNVQDTSDNSRYLQRDLDHTKDLLKLAEEALARQKSEGETNSIRVRDLQRRVDSLSLEQKESMNENSLLKGKLENMELENTQMTQDLVKLRASVKLKDDQIKSEQTRWRENEEKVAELEGKVVSITSDLVRSRKTAEDANREASEARLRLADLEAIEAENFHLHSILKLKDEEELRSNALQAQKALAQARRERDDAHEEMERRSSGIRDTEKAMMVEKLLARVSELETENQGLSLYVDKLIKDALDTKLAMDS